MPQKELVEEYLINYINELAWPRAEALQKLKSSIEYSLLGDGKRFRPTLCLQIAEAFGAHPKALLPWAAAIEMIHTYSLIHDDLPAMDDDKLRRGKPTNHIAFDEATALLAGDALLTEAFAVIAKAYQSESNIVTQLVLLLSEASGVLGMVGGQMMDLEIEDKGPAIQELNLIHRLKTGALIRVACEGSAVVVGLPKEKQKLLRQFGESLGLAFQLKDDLLDSDGLFSLLGKEETEAYLKEVSDNAHGTLQELQMPSGSLHEIIDFNINRNI